MHDVFEIKGLKKGQNTPARRIAEIWLPSAPQRRQRQGMENPGPQGAGKAATSKRTMGMKMKNLFRVSEEMRHWRILFTL
jgi:hypothetical protein